MSREVEIVLYGATGFSGRWAARYLAKQPDLRWAIAGRDRKKLEALRRELVLPHVPILVAESQDVPALTDMCRRTQVVVSTAGPFARYGDRLVEACVNERTHYADITGETPWARSLIDRFHARAAAEGTRIVPFAGYDSVPSDLGVYMLAHAARRDLGCGLRQVLCFHKTKSGTNGGSLATLLTLAESGDLPRTADPWLLSPDFVPTPAARRFDADPRGVFWLPELASHCAPFIMSFINTRVVRRSAALLAGTADDYGRDFAYQEYLQTRSRLLANAMALAIGKTEQAMRWKALRALLERLGPAPGQGPSDRAVKSGFMLCDWLGEAEDGTPLRARLFAEGDAGNANTTRFLCETGLALARDKLPERAGVLTPATAVGQRLLERLLESGVEIQGVDAGGRLCAITDTWEPRLASSRSSPVI